MDDGRRRPGGGVRERGEELIAPSSGPGARADRPWVIETAKNKEALSLLGRAVRPRSHESGGPVRAWGGWKSSWRPGPGTRASPRRKVRIRTSGRAPRSARGLLDRSMHRYAAAVRLAPPYADAWDRPGVGLYNAPVDGPRDPEAASKPSGDVEKGLAVMRQRHRHESQQPLSP